MPKPVKRPSTYRVQVMLTVGQIEALLKAVPAYVEGGAIRHAKRQLREALEAVQTEKEDP